MAVRREAVAQVAVLGIRDLYSIICCLQTGHQRPHHQRPAPRAVVALVVQAEPLATNRPAQEELAVQAVAVALLDQVALLATQAWQ